MFFSSVQTCSQQPWLLATLSDVIRWLRQRLSLIGEWNGQSTHLPSTEVQNWTIYSLLQQGREIIFPYLLRIFCACLAVGYYSAIWCKVKVVFIPKTRRNSSIGPRRSISTSLTSLLLTTMARLVDGALVLDHCIPINKFTRLENLWKWVFSLWFGLRRHLTCRIQLWVFSWTYELLTAPLLIPNVLLWVVTWSAPVLSSGLELPWRAAWPQQLPVSRLGGSGVQGCPQGGVLSPTSPVVPHCHLFLRLKEGSICTQGYADYSCLLAVDKFLNTVRAHTEDYLHC